RLERQRSRQRLARKERGREVVGVERRRVDRRLEVVAEDDVTEEGVQRPLVLLVAAWSPDRQRRLPVAQRDRRRERRARPAPRGERGREPLLEPEHLCSRAQRPAERGD